MGPAEWGPRGEAKVDEDLHRHLNITEDEWVAFMDDLRQSLARIQVSAEEENDVVALVESTKAAIVVLPPLQSEPSKQ